MGDSPDFVYPSQTLADSDPEEEEGQNGQVQNSNNAHMDETTNNPGASADAEDVIEGDGAEPNEANGVTQTPAADDNDSDNESVLSEVDEAQFEDFDPTAIAIEERPAIAIDETNVGLLGQHKKKRTEGDISREGKRKKKKKRERGTRRGVFDDDEDFVGGEEIEGKRRRRADDGGERRERAKVRQRTPERDEDLTPEERRRRALDRAMDEALKNPSKRRRKLGGIDLDAMADAEIEEMRRRMTEAAQADNDARSRGQVAMHKVRMLPAVVALLNRNTLQSSLVDPDINLLEAVRFFLEPLSDGSLPAYNIQRELFGVLTRLPIQKDVLVASGIGKVTLFYTKSSRPEQGIKRTAEKLLGEWTRPILKRSDDYRKREYAEAVYDPSALPIRPSAASQQADSIRNRALALADTSLSNRARVDNSGPTSYTVVPRSNIAPGGPGSGAATYRAPGKGGGGEMWKRIKSRGQETAAGGAGASGGGGSQRRR